MGSRLRYRGAWRRSGGSRRAPACTGTGGAGPYADTAISPAPPARVGIGARSVPAESWPGAPRGHALHSSGRDGLSHVELAVHVAKGARVGDRLAARRSPSVREQADPSRMGTTRLAARAIAAARRGCARRPGRDHRKVRPIVRGSRDPAGLMHNLTVANTLRHPDEKRASERSNCHSGFRGFASRTLWRIPDSSGLEHGTGPPWSVTGRSAPPRPREPGPSATRSSATGPDGRDGVIRRGPRVGSAAGRRNSRRPGSQSGRIRSSSGRGRVRRGDRIRPAQSRSGSEPASARAAAFKCSARICADPRPRGSPSRLGGHFPLDARHPGSPLRGQAVAGGSQARGRDGLGRTKLVVRSGLARKAGLVAGP